MTAAVGDLFGPIEIGSVAHGGHWIARHDGLVLFVRGALSGELVDVRVTEVARTFARADAVAILRPSPDRVAAPCPAAGRCGGCDFQHVAVPAQRELKRVVVAEQMYRLADVRWEGAVESVHPDDLHWRRRVRYHAGPDGWGMRAHRSETVVPLPPGGCRIAVAELASPPTAPRASGGQVPHRQVLGVAAADGVRWLTPHDGRLVRESAAGRSWRVEADGFWQVHPQAADTLVDAVLTGLAPRQGESGLDLYCGVGLFSGALVDHGVTVTGIEGSKAAAELARRNVREGTFLVGSVERVLGRVSEPVDLVVLDPPRSGAGRLVMNAVLRRARRAVAYVACDPAALARDVGTALASGWELASLRAFDLFPMTHHVECVAILTPGRGDDRMPRRREVL